MQPGLATPFGEGRYLGKGQVGGQGNPFLPQQPLLLICQEQGLTGQLGVGVQEKMRMGSGSPISSPQAPPPAGD